MSRFRLLATALLVALCTGFSSCGGDDKIDPKTPEPEPVADKITVNGKTDFIFTTNGGEETLSFSTNKDWTITVANTANSESWCTVTPASGAMGSNNVKIKVTENTGYDDRNVSLTIQVGSVTKTVTVTQKQKDALTLTTDKFEVGKTGATINVEVKSNITYEVIIPETSKSWIKQSVKTRGLTNSNLSFDIAASEEYEKREGEIIIQSGELSETVHVYQTGEGILLLTKNEYLVSNKGETITVEIKSNFEFDIQMPNVDWIQPVAKTRGMSSHTLYYTISPNETYDNREAEIVFFDKNSSIKETLKIIQTQNDAIKRITQIKSTYDDSSYTVSMNYKDNKLSKFVWTYDDDPNEYEFNQSIAYANNKVTITGIVDGHECEQTYTLNNKGYAASCSIPDVEGRKVEIVFEYTEAGYLSKAIEITQRDTETRTNTYTFKYQNNNVIEVRESEGNSYTISYGNQTNKTGLVNYAIEDILFDYQTAYHAGILGKLCASLPDSYKLMRSDDNSLLESGSFIYSTDSNGYVTKSTRSTSRGKHEVMTYSYE